MLSGANSAISDSKQAAFTLPKNRSAVYDLGRMTGQLETNLVTTDSTTKSHAAAMLQIPESEVDVKLLQSVAEAIHDYDENGLGAKVRGLFSFVNLIWILAGSGFVVSIGPVFLAFMTSMERVLQRAPRLLIFIIDSLDILETAAQAFLFWLSFYIIAAAGRYPSDYNYFIALSGCLLAIPIFDWSEDRKSRRNRYDLLESLWPDVTLAMSISLTLATTAVAYQSSLIGFLAVGAFFHGIGLCLPLPFLFDTDDILYQVAAASFVVLQALIIGQIGGIKSLLPFKSGAQVFGSIGLFLSGLIKTAQSPCVSSFNLRDYAIINVGYLAILFLFIFAGSVLNLAGLYNTGCVFAFLWLLVKIMDLGFHKSFWYTIFVASIALWQFALWLHNHPHFVEAMFVG